MDLHGKGSTLLQTILVYITSSYQLEGENTTNIEENQKSKKEEKKSGGLIISAIFNLSAR